MHTRFGTDATGMGGSDPALSPEFDAEVPDVFAKPQQSKRRRTFFNPSDASGLTVRAI